MEIDLLGRLNKIRLPVTNSMSPLFEAIINSIHAIEENGGNGQIDVYVEREKSQRTIDDGQSSVASHPISGFRVRDNGVGFTKKNFDSFETSDTTLKVSKGGKGVGRFLWLKAFEEVRVESVFSEGDKWRLRSFEFRATKRGVENASLKETHEVGSRTDVHLSGFLEKYRDQAPKTAATIGRHIIEHCMEYFVFGKVPTFFLHDDDEGDKYDLRRMFNKEILLGKSNVDIVVKGKKFHVTHVRTSATTDSENRICYCAHGCAVKVEGLKSKIPNLQRATLCDEAGTQFYYLGLVSGKYLDDRVNSERTRFDLFDELHLNMPDEVGWEELAQASVDSAKQYLSPFTGPIQKEKEERIRNYVQQSAPQYRPLLKHRGQELDSIPPNLKDAELDVELYRRSHKYDIELREIAGKLLSKKDDDQDYSELKKYFGKFIEEWNEQGISKLAQYIVHRKSTLAFFEQRLRVRDDGKYPLEDSVHKIVFPLRSTSDDVPADGMNLWIIDEKLAYHYYLASDKYLDQIEEFKIDHHDRPDILIFNNPIAFAESGPTFSSIVVIEFKRPMRNDYQDSDPAKNPISQVYQYIREIRSGTKNDRHGRPITVFENTRFYAYIICDLTKSLRTLAEDAGMIPSPDSQGYFFFNRNLNTFVEIMSFDKLLDDAKKRNASLFDKLNIQG